MTRYFTHYWRNETLDEYREAGDRDLEYVADSKFAERGLDDGDVVYPVTVYSGILYLIGRLEAKRVSERGEVSQQLGYEPSYRSSHYVIAVRPTVKHFDLQVPLEVTGELKFISGEEVRSPVFESPDRLDRQTIRGVRELHPDSAAILDHLLSRN